MCRPLCADIRVSLDNFLYLLVFRNAIQERWPPFSPGVLHIAVIRSFKSFNIQNSSDVPVCHAVGLDAIDHTVLPYHAHAAPHGRVLVGEADEGHGDVVPEARAGHVVPHPVVGPLRRVFGLGPDVAYLLHALEAQADHNVPLRLELSGGSAGRAACRSSVLRRGDGLHGDASAFAVGRLHDPDGLGRAVHLLRQGALRNVAALFVGEVSEAEAQVLVEADLGTLSEAALKGAGEAGLEEELERREEGVQGPVGDSCCLFSVEPGGACQLGSNSLSPTSRLGWTRPGAERRSLSWGEKWWWSSVLSVVASVPRVSSSFFNSSLSSSWLPTGR